MSGSDTDDISSKDVPDTRIDGPVAPEDSKESGATDTTSSTGAVEKSLDVTSETRVEDPSTFNKEHHEAGREAVFQTRLPLGQGPPEPSDGTMQYKSWRYEPIARRELTIMLYAGLLFCICGVALLGFAAFSASRVMAVADKGAQWPSALIPFYSSIAILTTGVIAAIFGAMLLRAGGAGSREVIPKRDAPLLEQLLVAAGDDGLDDYIRLASLTGWVGMFTKVGLTGLPLATIGLTIFFALIALSQASEQNPFMNLAELTLGAFIGSFVQRQVSAREERVPIGGEAQSGK